MTLRTWRRVVAAAADIAIASVPVLIIGAAWISLVAGAIDLGSGDMVGLLAYYGAPVLLFTGPAVLWAAAIWRASRGRSAFRSPGMVVAGLARDEAHCLVAASGTRSLGAVSLRVGTAALAVGSACVLALIVYLAGSLAYSTLHPMPDGYESFGQGEATGSSTDWGGRAQ